MTDLLEIQTVYDVYANHQIRAHNVANSLTKNFSTALRKVRKRLNDDDPMVPLLTPLWRYRYLLSASILPLNHPQLYPEGACTILESQHKNLVASYPSIAKDFDLLMETLAGLELCEDAPLLNQVKKVANEAAASSQALLVRDKRYIPLMLEVISTCWSGALPFLITEQQLREARCFDRLYVVGPISHYREHVIRAPRARTIDVVRYEWTGDEIEQGSFLAQPLVPLKERENISIRSPITTTDDSLFGLPELRPSVDVESLAAQYSTKNHQDIVEARLVVLEGDFGVFMELEDTVFVVNPSHMEDDRIDRIPLSNLNEGDYLVLRAEGGGDYVVKVADEIMGNRASVLRQRQEHWKSTLRKLVQQKGIDEVAKSLRYLGAQYADPINVRNWIGKRSLGPRIDKDFCAVLECVGLNHSIDEYRKSLGDLRKAHRKAGHKIRRQLIDQIGRSDMQALEHNGFMQVTLPNEDGGGFNIYRILNLPMKTAIVPYHSLGHVFSIGV